jgi:hypothetical protein
MTERVKNVTNTAMEKLYPDATEGDLVKYRITPTQMRHIFITGVRSGDTPFTAEQEEASAYLMGNSVKTWDSHYDEGRISKRVNQALTGIGDRIGNEQTHNAAPPAAPPQAPPPYSYITMAEAEMLGGIELRELHQKMFQLDVPTTSHNLAHLRAGVTGTQTRGPQRKRKRTSRMMSSDRNPIPNASPRTGTATATHMKAPTPTPAPATAPSSTDTYRDIRIQRQRDIPRKVESAIDSGSGTSTSSGIGGEQHRHRHRHHHHPRPVAMPVNGGSGSDSGSGSDRGMRCVIS